MLAGHNRSGGDSVSILDGILWDPIGALFFVVGCSFAWSLAPALELGGASVRVERLRDLRLGSWLALAAAVLGVVAFDSGFLYRHFSESQWMWLTLARIPLSALIPVILVVAGAGFRPSRRVALILIGVLWTLGAAWMLPSTIESNTTWYRYGLIPYSILEAFVDAAPPVSGALISVIAGTGIRHISHAMGRGGESQRVLPVPPESVALSQSAERTLSAVD